MALTIEWLKSSENHTEHHDTFLDKLTYFPTSSTSDMAVFLVETSNNDSCHFRAHLVQYCLKHFPLQKHISGNGSIFHGSSCARFERDNFDFLALRGRRYCSELVVSCIMLRKLEGLSGRYLWFRKPRL